MARIIFTPGDSGSSGGDDGNIAGPIFYAISAIIAAFIFVPQDGWVWGLIKAFFWYVVLIVKFFQWIF